MGSERQLIADSQSPVEQQKERRMWRSFAFLL
jgi:hypothetical protein